MSFKTLNGTEPRLCVAGEFLESHPNFIITAPKTDGTAKAGYFSKIDTDGETLILSDGSDSVGVTVQSNTNLAECGDNKLIEYQSLGMVYVALKDGIAPKFGEYIKVDATGVADIGAIGDGIGRFLGIYGAKTEDSTPLNTMLIQLGGI